MTTLLPTLPITTSTTPLNHLNLQMNLALRKQVLDFIIIFLDLPLVGCQSECAQEMWRFISWGECWKGFQSDRGCLGLPQLQNHFFLFACWILCVTDQCVGELKFSQLCWGQLLLLSAFSQFRLDGSSSASNNAPHFLKLTAAIFKSREQKLQFFLLTALLRIHFHRNGPPKS